ncbi:MAG TPA: copper amine oxidase N-terminal domain-containing protein [Candidatus Rubrimentiphilum sp.]|nr:copper amine oxidase N-terminal domain-containing protein [Candidatus Rubrimentiphilum sp.]
MRYKAPGWKTLAVTAVLAIAASISYTLAKPVEVRIDGQPMVSDVPPVRTNAETVFVPLRPLSEALGAEARYDDKSGDIFLTHGDQLLHLKIGDRHATLNGMPMTLLHAPFRVRGRAMIGLHTVQRAFGVRVKYDKSASRVDVDTLGTAVSASP